MKKKRLIEQRTELLKAEGEQLTRLDKEEKGLDGEELAAYDARHAEIEELNTEIDGIEKREAATRKSAEQLARVGAGGTDAAVEVHNKAADKPWASLGEQLHAIARVETHHEIEPRLRAELAISGGSEKVGADGGFLVQKDFSTVLLSEGRKEAVILPRCREIPLGSGSNAIVLPIRNETSRETGSRGGGVRVYRREEAGTVTASKPTFDLVEIKAEPLMALAYATDELLMDVPAMSSFYQQEFVDEFAFVIDDEIIRGGGAGNCLGIFNAPNWISQTKETGQAADTIVHENVTKIWSRVPARSKGRGNWFVNSECWPQLEDMSLPVGTGGSATFMPARGDADAPLGRLKGRPIVEIEHASAIGDVGDIFFADFSQYLIVTKGGITSDASLHVRFIYNEMTFRWNYRINGQPRHKSALTPYKGTATKSPFIGIAAR